MVPFSANVIVIYSKVFKCLTLKYVIAFCICSNVHSLPAPLLPFLHISLPLPPSLSHPPSVSLSNSPSLPYLSLSSPLSPPLCLSLATCEMCGMVGVRDAFYSKTKRFCSVSCSRSYSSNSKKASILARLQVERHTHAHAHSHMHASTHTTIKSLNL